MFSRVASHKNPLQAIILLLTLSLLTTNKPLLHRHTREIKRNEGKRRKEKEKIASN